METIDAKKIEAIIYEVRDFKVMLDSDLAELYGVKTKDLIRQVRRNISRFPDDFLLLPNFEELEDLRRQFVTANTVTSWNHMRRTIPMLFTENGVAMLSSVLNSECAIQVNIAIIRVFIRMRSFLAIENTNSQKINKLERETKSLFKIVFEKMDNFESLVTPKLPQRRKKIGLKE